MKARKEEGREDETEQLKMIYKCDLSKHGLKGTKEGKKEIELINRCRGIHIHFSIQIYPSQVHPSAFPPFHPSIHLFGPGTHTHTHTYHKSVALHAMTTINRSRNTEVWYGSVLVNAQARGNAKGQKKGKKNIMWGEGGHGQGMDGMASLEGIIRPTALHVLQQKQENQPMG